MSGRDGGGRFMGDAARVFGGQAVMVLIGVGTGVITARWLGPEGRGLFQLVVVITPLMLANLVKLGVPQASVYCIRRDGASPSAVVSNATVLALAVGGALALACWAGRDWVLANLLKGAPVRVFAPVLVLLPFVLLQAYLLGIAQGLQRFREYTFQQIVPTVLSFLGMAVVLIGCGAGVVGAVYTQTAILVAVCLWLARRIHRVAAIRPHFDAALARRMLRFGAKSHVQTLAATWHLRIDQILIGYLLDPTQVGLYAVAVNFANLLLRVPDALGTVLFPRLAGADAARGYRATAVVCRFTVAIMTAGAVGYVLAGPAVLRLLFGARFEASIAPMLVLLPGMLLMGLYLILSRNFTSRDRQQVNIVAASLALAANVTLNLVLVPKWGIVGAAAASVVSYGLAAGVLAVAFLRASGQGALDLLLLRAADLGRLRGARPRPGAAPAAE